MKQPCQIRGGLGGSTVTLLLEDGIRTNKNVMKSDSAESHHLELMSVNDLAPVTAIFNEAIKAGETTQALQHQTVEQCRSWLLDEKPEYEAYVYRQKSQIMGWVALTRFHEREAYLPTAELSVYVTQKARGQGIGRKLVEKGLVRAKELNFHSVMLVLFPEPQFIFEWAKKLGFTEQGRLQGAVPKNSIWQDVILLQCLLDFSGVDSP
ncbi:MAG: N-acetyltransferase family protein, partial [Halothece sp.]